MGTLVKRRNFVAAFSAAAVGRPSFSGGASLTAEGGVYDVTAYGAKGDGRSDDRAALQAAIEAAENAGGGTIYFPPGTYLCSYVADHDTGGLGIGVRPYSVILRNAGRLTFRGAGRGLSILQKTTIGGRGADYNLFITRAVAGFSVQHVSFEDLTLDGGQTSATSPFTSGDEHLFFAARVNGLTVDRCEIRNARGGGFYIWQSNYVRLENCHFELLDRAGVNNAITLIGSVAGAEPWYGAQLVRDCTFVNNGQMNIGIGGYRGSGRLADVIVSGCFFFTDISVAPNAQAIETVSVPTGPLERVTIEDCNVYGGRGITVQGTDVSIRRCVFRQINSATPWGQAIAFVNPPNAKRVTFEDVVVDTTTDEGILIGGSGDIRLINVSVFNAGKEGIKQAPDAWGRPQSLAGAQFIGCRAVDCQRDGFSIASDDVHFVDCIATGNGKAQTDAHSGLVIQPGSSRTVVIGGRFGAEAEAQQGFGIDNGGTRTRLVDASVSGHVGPVNLRNPLAVAQPVASPVIALPHGPSVATDARLGSQFRITVTGNSPMTLEAPSNGVAGQEILYDILNSSGGAMGGITWGDGSVFQMAGPFTNPGNGYRRTIRFYYDGTNWVETGRSVGDIGR